MSALIYLGGQSYMESPSRVLLGLQSEEFGWFPSMSTSYTPIRVDTRDVGCIRAVFPTSRIFRARGQSCCPGSDKPPSSS